MSQSLWLTYSSDYVRVAPDRSRSRDDPPMWSHQVTLDNAILSILTHGMRFHLFGNLAEVRPL